MAGPIVLSGARLRRAAARAAARKQARPSVSFGIRSVRKAPDSGPRPESGANPHEDARFSQQPDLPRLRATSGECALDRLAEIAGDHHRAVDRALHLGEDRGLHGGDHGDAERAGELRHPIVQDADQDQHPDFDEEADLAGPCAGNAAQPRGNHDADEKGEQRRHEVKRLLPSRRPSHTPRGTPGWPSGRSPECRGDPGIGVEIAAGERQQQRDQQGLVRARIGRIRQLMSETSSQSFIGPIDAVPATVRIDLNQAVRRNFGRQISRGKRRGNATMNTVRWIIYHRAGNLPAAGRRHRHRAGPHQNSAVSRSARRPAS